MLRSPAVSGSVRRSIAWLLTAWLRASGRRLFGWFSIPFPSAGIVRYLLHPIFRPTDLYRACAVSIRCLDLVRYDGQQHHVRSIVSLSLAATGSSPDPSGQVGWTNEYPQTLVLLFLLSAFYKGTSPLQGPRSKSKSHKPRQDKSSNMF